MKLLKVALLITVVAFSVAALAQAPQPQGAPGGPSGHRMGGMMGVDHQLAKMTKDLNLTADQQAQIKPILQEQQHKMRELHRTTDSKIQAVLTDEQKKKMEEMKHHGRRDKDMSGPGNKPPASK
jgi:Spy/CpxP family protein refolding chaperone